MEFYVDKHVVKMIIESVQILSTVNRIRGFNEGYKPTHLNHPCVVWTNKSLNNYLYVKNLSYALIKEWKYRFHEDEDIIHKSEFVLAKLTLPKFDDIKITTPAQCMPEYCKESNYIQAYRNYYINEKQHIAKWTKRPVPYWFKIK